MTPLSLNPRASALSTPALSEHSVMVLRPLLRSILMWHRCRTRMVPFDQELDFDDIEVEEGADPEVPANEELQRVLNEPYASAPAASALTPGEIKVAIDKGQDPFAQAIDQSSNTTRFLERPPVPTLIMAARFAALLTSAELQRDITAPRAFTMLTIADNEEREAVWKHIDSVLRRSADLCDETDDTWRGFATPCLHATPDSKHRLSEQVALDTSIATAVRKGYKLIVLAADTTTTSDVTRALCQRTFQLPQLTGQMILEILRATHSATGELSEDAIANLLPPDSEIAALPQAVIEAAFLEETSLKVSKSLAAAAARLRAEPPATTTLEDIVLNANTRAPIDRLVADMAAWKTGQVQWTEVSSSILFFGPPGNGKTLLASALAGSLKTPLIATSYSDCQKHGHQGDMLKALSAKVEEAIRSAPCVFFLDELDGFTHRDRPNRNSDYIVGVVNGLLEHLTRLNNTPGVVVLGATNYPDMIDPAITRPGRFDLKIELSNPDRPSILKILELALGEDAKEVRLGSIADQLLGSSGAQITALVREARGLARAEHKQLAQAHLETVAAQICPVLNQDLLWRIAVHEAGHLVVAHALELPPAARATITQAGGFVDIPLPMLESRDSATARIAALLGGRAAEQIILGEALNGSGLGKNSDLELATHLAAQVMFEWGLDDQLAFTPIDVRTMSQTKAGQIDKALNDAHLRAIGVITDKQPLVLTIAQALVNGRDLPAKQLQELFS